MGWDNALIPTVYSNYLFKKNSIIIGFDNVDCDLIYKHLLKQSNHLFCLNPTHEIPIILSKFKASYIHSIFNFNNLFYFFFSTFWAYILNGFFARIIGYIGVYLLLKTQFKLKNKGAILFLLLMYALIPFYSIILIAQIAININNDTEVGGNIKRLIGFKSEAYFEFLNKSLIDPFNRNIQDNKWPFQQIASFGFFVSDRQIRTRVLGHEDIYFDKFILYLPLIR